MASRVRRALGFTISENYIVLLLQFLSSLVIARLLTPEEIGITSVAIVLVGFAHLLRDFGVSQYLIQERELTQAKIQAAFGLTLVIAWVSAVVIALASGWAAEFYGEPGVRWVMCVLALNFVLIPFGSVITPLLRRDFMFGQLFVIRVLSTLMSGTAVITFAAVGMGYMSQPWAALAGVLVTVGLALHFRPQEARLRPSFRGLRSVMQFGGFITLAGMITEAGIRAPELIVGKVLDMGAVGYLGRATALPRMVSETVMAAARGVVLPHFADVRRRGRDVAAAYSKGLAYITGLAWPAFVFMGIMAFPVIRILYGSQWDAAIPLVPFFAAAGIVGITQRLNASLLTAAGAVRAVTMIELIGQSAGIAIVLVSAPRGLDVLAPAMLGAAMLRTLISHCVTIWNTDLTLGHLFAALWRSGVLTVACGSTIWAIARAFPPAVDNLWEPVLLAAVAGSSVWLVSVILLRHPLTTEIDLVIGRVDPQARWIGRFRSSPIRGSADTH